MKYVVLLVMAFSLAGCDSNLSHKKPVSFAALQAMQKQENTITKKVMQHETKHPNPNTPYPVDPIEGVTRTVFLKNVIKNPQNYCR